MIEEKKLLEELEDFTLSVGGNANAMALCIIDECKKQFMKMVENQPQVDNWILCNERLPTQEECFDNNNIFFVSNGEETYLSYYDNKEKTFWYDIQLAIIDNTIVKWMPLPKP